MARFDFSTIHARCSSGWEPLGDLAMSWGLGRDAFFNVCPRIWKHPCTQIKSCRVSSLLCMENQSLDRSRYCGYEQQRTSRTGVAADWGAPRTTSGGRDDLWEQSPTHGSAVAELGRSQQRISRCREREGLDRCIYDLGDRLKNEPKKPANVRTLGILVQTTVVLCR